MAARPRSVRVAGSLRSSQSLCFIGIGRVAVGRAANHGHPAVLLRSNSSAAKTVAHETPMVAIHPQSDAPQPKSRWFRFTWLKLLVFILLLTASGVGLVVWSTALPLYSTADY